MNLKRLTRQKGSGYSFIYKRDSIWDVRGAESRAVERALKSYRSTLAPDRQFLLDRYRVADVGFKVVGTGSVGTRDYVVLLLGRESGANDPLFLQIKEEPPSPYAAYYPAHGAHAKDRAPTHQGQRVVLGQRALQVFSDMLLGWCSIAGRDFLVRQLSDHKSSIEPEDLKGDRLTAYARVCAELLAKGHARSGEPAVQAAYLGRAGKAEKALTQFAQSYAAQIEKDHDAFRKALKQGFVRDAIKLADHARIFR
jgi:uncharacterized protein (DUF2252 family)